MLSITSVGTWPWHRNRERHPQRRSLLTALPYVRWCTGVLRVSDTNEPVPGRTSIGAESQLAVLQTSFVREIIVDGGFVGTLCAVLLKMFNTLVYAGVVFGVFYYAFTRYQKPNPRLNSKKPNSGHSLMA